MLHEENKTQVKICHKTIKINEFASGPGDRGFSPRSSHTKDSKMVLDAALLNTQHYKVRIKGKWGAILGKE